jgi:O-antigen biosynthesis protein
VNLKTAALTGTDSAPKDDSAPATHSIRPHVAGKFLFAGSHKFLVRGVTYGTFRPDGEGHLFPAPEVVERDFAEIARRGLNAIRTYTAPPRWLLDIALERDLRVMVGLAWEQHVTFLAERSQARAIGERVRAQICGCAGHPAVLCYAIGNEIPAPIVRWHGHGKIERFLARLHRLASAEDPGALFTYVNYPSTEYLRLPFLDLVCFNVYLEHEVSLRSYLARLHNLAGDRPLLLAEVGLDSRRNGLEAQTHSLEWQIRASFAAGGAGVFVFAWTDEWHRGGHDITDWDFGLTTRDRRPKPALDAVSRAFSETPFPATGTWPRISVVVCTYNGARTLHQCLRAVQALHYPDFEVIVVDDGSRDDSAAIARTYGARVISTENRGLSAARNAGMQAASGEIVAYIDDDAYPDPDWLTYLANAFRSSRHAAAGGPNIAPPGDGPIADCVVNAPGGPVHVLINDEEAEHIPGCNMAFRRQRLVEVGGFDTQFRAAGDDVDLCWRILERGWTIGFSPAAVVWHHRRNSLRSYWRQQRGYGKAEALLERKWPEKYNSLGHVQWGGQLYGPGLTQVLFRQHRVYHGPWGTAPFQRLHQSPPSLLAVAPTMPEWYLVVIALAGLSALASLWPKLVFAIPLLALAAGATLVQAILSSARASFPGSPRGWLQSFGLHALTAGLHLVQPLARLWGRARHGLTAWRWRLPHALLLPIPRSVSFFTDQWRTPENLLQAVAGQLRKDGAVLVIGGPYDRWELEVRGGTLGAARLCMTTEEHGAGKQLFRFRSWPRFSLGSTVAILTFTGLASGAALDQYWAAYNVLALVTLGLLGRTLFETGGAMAALRQALHRAARDIT